MINLKSPSKIVFIGILLSFSLFAFRADDRYFEIQKNLDIFTTLYKEVNMFYVDEVNPNTLMRKGIESMLSSLDPYTNYIPEDEIEDYRTLSTGKYGGIGAITGNRNGKMLIIMPFNGSPAQEAGLIIGDQILAIDGINIDGKNTSQVSKLLKGQANTKVILSVKSIGQDAPRDVEIVRQNIKIDNVPYYGKVANDVGYIKLTDFTQNASREVQNALEKLKAEGATKIVLDLRGNPGGLLSEAVNISNLFINRDLEVVSTKGKIKEWNKTYRANRPPVDTEIPIVVLTNGRSASASEIVSGVIQDYDRGILIGQRTFGKGLVQATRRLSYNSQLKVTTAKYYIPSGRCIQALDYSNRKEDGTVEKIADSLKTAFKTKNGRVVYDGAGVKPDIELEVIKKSPISNSLIRKNLIFQYANEYHHKHPSITSAQEFKMSEAEYQEFLTWVKGKNYDYTTQVEKTLEELEEKSKEEKYYEGIKSQLQSLKTKISHNKEADLLTFKDEIKALLEVEIASRYYLQKGQTEASFNQDPDLQAALELFQNMDRYQKLLQPK